MAKRVLVLIPTKSGDPRRVATHSSGKCFDLNANAKAPSCCRMSREEELMKKYDSKEKHESNATFSINGLAIVIN